MNRYSMPEENLEIVCEKMKMSKEEKELLYREAGYRI